MAKTKDFRLFKRDDTGKELPADAAGYRDRAYYFKFTHRGKPYVRCLETNDKVEAQKRAKLKYAEIVSAVSTGAYNKLDATKLRSANTATLEQLCTAYRTGPAEASANTRTLNINALKQIAGIITLVSELTPALVRAWFTNIQKVIQTTSDQEAAASLKRSANSRWIQARSLFTDRCLAHYGDLEVVPPSGLAGLEAFVKAGNLASFTRIPKQNYNPPAETVIAKTLADWEKIEDRDLFLTIGHELAFGLRLSEMACAKWDWHSQRNGYPVLDGRTPVKGGTGLIQVRALDPFYSTMVRIAKEKKWWPEDMGSNVTLIIQGTDTYRTDDIFRGVSAWIRAHGWETQKTNHALRAYAGSQVAMKYGIYEAQMFLRHSSVKVTEQNYSHFVSKFKPSDLDTIPTRWAVIPAVAAPVAAKVSSAAPDDTLDATRDFQHPPAASITVLPWIAPARN